MTSNRVSTFLCIHSINNQLFPFSLCFSPYSDFQSKRFMRAPLTLKLCAEVWRTGYEYFLNPGNENSKLEMETPKFPAKIDFNFHWKSSSLQIETSDFRLRKRFSVFVSE